MNKSLATHQLNNKTTKELSDEVVVSVKNVSKKFCKHLRRSMAYGIADLSKNLLGIKPNSNELRNNEFWAVEDVSFELRRGEVLGLIGVNGSGKSTLLRLLAGIFPPDKGEISVKGRVGALIALGAGFHPHMTGRENIYLNGTIYGMSHKEIVSKFDDIVDFAEIGGFLDAPVSTYSSGMRVRLGFSIAAHIEPDLLLLDEVLAVGDVNFRAKCYNFISDIIKKSAVIFVSHSMPLIYRYCTRTLLLNYGKLLHSGIPDECIDKYYKLFDREKGTVFTHGTNRIEEFRCMDMNNNLNVVEHASTIRIKMSCKIDKRIKFPVIYIVFLNRDLQVVASCRSKQGSIVNDNGFISLNVEIAPFILTPSDYKISVIAFDEEINEHLFWYNAFWNLKVVGGSKDYGSAVVHFASNWETAL